MIDLLFTWKHFMGINNDFPIIVAGKENSINPKIKMLGKDAPKCLCTLYSQMFYWRMFF